MKCDNPLCFNEAYAPAVQRVPTPGAPKMCRACAIMVIGTMLGVGIEEGNETYRRVALLVGKAFDFAPRDLTQMFGSIEPKKSSWALGPVGSKKKPGVAVLITPDVKPNGGK